MDTSCITPELIYEDGKYIMSPATLLDQAAKKLQEYITKKDLEALPFQLQKTVLEQAKKDLNKYLFETNKK